MKAPGISMYAILNAYQTAISVMESLIALMAQMKIPAFAISGAIKVATTVAHAHIAQNA